MTDPTSKPFGTVFADNMATCSFTGGQWAAMKIEQTGPISLHPSAHVFHYASCCFEGLKAYRFANGDVRLFRMDRNVARMQKSAELLKLPVPDADTLATMIREVVKANIDSIPDAPGSLYLRPTLIGTEMNIGKASAKSTDALLFVLASPVGDYFKDGVSPLKVIVDDVNMRSTPDFGMAKAGANYAQALRIIDAAKADHGADQVLFSPGDDAQETGAANFLMMNDREVVTRHLDGSFLHGITRDSLLVLAKDLGYAVHERRIGVTSMMNFCRDGEAGLSGTAAVLAPIGELVYRNKVYSVGDGGAGPNILRLRDALIDVQTGRADDRHGWIDIP